MTRSDSSRWGAAARASVRGAAGVVFAWAALTVLVGLRSPLRTVATVLLVGIAVALYVTQRKLRALAVGVIAGTIVYVLLFVWLFAQFDGIDLLG